MAQYSFLKFSEDGKKIIKCDNGVTGHIDIPVGITHISPEAFEYCSGIESISIPNTIKSIGRDAFCGCHNLRDVYISDLSAWLNIRFEGSCTLDGLSYPQSMANPLCYAERLFLNDEIVEDLVIPEGIESICDYAFCSYEGLKSITFPKSLTTIGRGAFFRCDLESVQFFDNLHFIGFHSFQECKNLSLVSFSDGLSTDDDCIGDYAFKGCIKLSSICLPSSFTVIGQSAFKDCEKLEFVNIPSVQDLGHSCFKGCRILSSIELPSSLISIGAGCFYDTALSYIKIPKSVSEIYPFSNMNIYIDVEPGNENYISIDGSLFNTNYDRRGKVLVKYFCSSPNVSIKDVRHIGSNAFSGCKLLKSIIIDGPVDSIGSAFHGCENIEEVILPNGITRIDGFEGCKKLLNIVIPESVVVIGERTFKDCISLNKIVLPSQLIRIGKSAFLGCKNLVEIEMPKSIEEIGDNAFADCSSLEEIVIPSKIKELSHSCFKNCHNLSKIVIPNSIRRIDFGTFDGCEKLQLVIISDIGAWCTIDNQSNPISKSHHMYNEDETEITELRIPYTINSINSHAFDGCYGIESVHIPECIENVGYKAFENCEGLKDVTIETPNVANVLSELKGCINIETLSIKHFNESFCFGLRCFKKLKSIYSIDNTGNRVVIDVSKILLSKAQELKLMSLYYHNLGMNLTQINGEFSDISSFKKPVEIKGTTLDDLYNTKQDTSVLLEQDWMHASGLGLVLGWGDYRALDFDCIDSKNIRSTISTCLQKLGLPEDYQWVVSTGSKKGFHIIIRVKDYCDKDSAPIAFAYLSKNHKRIELRWKGHLVLPPSIHYSGNSYSFFRNQIPNTTPQYIELGKIEKLIEDYCGENHFVCPNWNNISFKLVENRNNNTEDSQGKVVFDSWLEREWDHIKWYEACRTSQTYNSLALEYLAGKRVPANRSKAYELFLKADCDLSYFNIASLISVGFFEGTIKDINQYLEKISNKEKWEKEIDDIKRNARKYAIIIERTYYLFFDTETTGVPLNYKAPSSDTNNWPRLVQLAWILTDEEGNRIHTGHLIVKPDGFVIPADATKVHGITTQRAKEEGLPLAEAIEQFKSDLDMATYIVGHNIEFDKKIVGAEMIRLGMKDELEKKKSFCTMQSSIDFCKIPGKYGYKYPKLQELYRKIFDKDFEDAHNAMSDIEATEKCFWELRKRKLVILE